MRTTPFPSFLFADLMEMASEITLFAPVRVEPAVAELFFSALDGLAGFTPRIDFWFYDDNQDEQSSARLHQFVDRWSSRSMVLPPLELPRTDYSRAGSSHVWSNAGVARVTAIKNRAIAAMLESNSERLFLVDADVLIRPDLVDHLCEVGVDIISAVYWTQFAPSDPYLPNVWDFNGYDFDDAGSILALRSPGHHRVGGLGACTLVHRRALEAGVDFRPLPNLRLWGEDRHFCIRAAALGFDLVADSCLPPFHVYRESLVDSARAWLGNGMRPSWFAERWLTAAWEYAVKRTFGAPREASA
jgi:hypothetical protein